MAESEASSNSAVNDALNNSAILQTLGAILYIIYVAIIFILFIVNGVKVYQDLYGDRNSLSRIQEKFKPKLTGPYISIQLQTQTAILFFLVADCIMIFSYFFVENQLDCDHTQTAAAMTYQIAQTFLYLLFLTRYYWVYNKSKFPVSLTKVLTVSFIVILYNAAIILIMATTYTSTPPLVKGDIKYCNGGLEPITATLMSIQELVVTIVFLRLFYVQLLAISQKVDKIEDLYIAIAGRELFVLSGTSMILTIILVIVTAILDLNFIVGADAAINVICLLLLEPYYSRKLYQSLCGLCICCFTKCVCCDALKLSNEQQQQLENEKNAPLLTVRFVAEELKENYQLQTRNQERTNPIPDNSPIADDDSPMPDVTQQETQETEIITTTS